ncbi:hypothetical protein JCM11641_000652 [Rhodosporidiobolus odoratus]
MSRPFSPDSLSGNSEPSAPSSASKRICRGLVVEAEAHQDGVYSRLYCKVSLPTSTSTASSLTAEHRFQLVPLLPLSTLVSNATYALPLQPGDPAEAVQAARILGLTASEGGEGSIGRRRSLGVAPFAERREARVVRNGEEVCLVLLPRLEDEEDLQDVEWDSPSTARAPSRAGSFSPAPSVGISTARGRTTADLLVILEVEYKFGVLRLPSFANSVVIPMPLCLRNTLSFSLPSPPSSASSSAWDLSVRPSLTNATSELLGEDAGTCITGTFPSTNSILLRWASQLPHGQQDAQLVVHRASLDIRWSAKEGGTATAEVDVMGTFECAALREKQFVEIEVGLGQTDEANEVFEVLSCEGEEDMPVLGWGFVEQATPSPPLLPRPPPLPPSLDSFASPLDDSTLSFASLHSTGTIPASTEYPFTPTPRPRRRPPTSRSNEPRPPSFTSLFDTAPPPALDPNLNAVDGEVSLLEVQLPPEHRDELEKVGKDRRNRQKGSEGSSLLGQEAPFDPEASALDMSFEVGSASEEEEGEAEAEEPARPPSPAKSSTRLWIQLDLSHVLRRFATTTVAEGALPSFAFTLQLSFPASSLTANDYSTIDRPSLNRIALPSFALPAAQSEETVVSVAASSSRQRVELLPDSLPPYRLSSPPFNEDDDGPPPSPLPGFGGRARWSTVRGSGDLSKSGRRRKISGPVVVEIVRNKSKMEERRFLPAVGTEDDGSLAEEGQDQKATPPLSSSPADELALPRPSTAASTAHSTRSFLSSPSPASSHGPRPRAPTTIPLVKVHISPVPPSSPLSSPWRLFYRLTFSHPYSRPFALPVLPGAKVEVVGAWSVRGEGIEVDAEESLPLDEDGAREVRVLAKKGKDVAEVLFVEEKAGEELRVGTAIPAFADKLARLEVEVAAVQGQSQPSFLPSTHGRVADRLQRAGYDLDTANHGFDLVSPSSPTTTSTTFTRFLLPAEATANLALPLVCKPIEPVLSVESSVSSIPSFTLKTPQSRTRTPTFLAQMLQSTILALVGILAFRLASSYLPPLLSDSLSSPSSHLSSVVTATSTHAHLQHSPTFTSTISTVTSTHVSTAHVVSTTTHLAYVRSTITLTETETETYTLPHSTPTPAPSQHLPPVPSSPSSAFTFSFPDSLPLPSPSIKHSPARFSALHQHALAVEDSARTAVEAIAEDVLSPSLDCILRVSQAPLAVDVDDGPTKTLQVGSRFPAWDPDDSFIDLVSAPIAGKEGFEPRFRYKPKWLEYGCPYLYANRHCCSFSVEFDQDGKDHWVVKRVGDKHNHSFRPTPKQRDAAESSAAATITDVKRHFLQQEGLETRLRELLNAGGSDAETAGAQAEAVKDLVPQFGEKAAKECEKKMMKRGCLVASYTTAFPSCVALSSAVSSSPRTRSSARIASSSAGGAAGPSQQQPRLASSSSAGSAANSPALVSTPYIASILSGEATVLSESALDTNLRKHADAEGFRLAHLVWSGNVSARWICKERACGWQVNAISEASGRWRVDAVASQLAHYHVSADEQEEEEEGQGGEMDEQVETSDGGMEGMHPPNRKKRAAASAASTPAAKKKKPLPPMAANCRGQPIADQDEGSSDLEIVSEFPAPQAAGNNMATPSTLYQASPPRQTPHGSQTPSKPVLQPDDSADLPAFVRTLDPSDVYSELFVTDLLPDLLRAKIRRPDELKFWTQTDKRTGTLFRLLTERRGENDAVLEAFKEVLEELTQGKAANGSRV